MSALAPVIRIESVSKNFGSFEVLKNVSSTVHASEVIVLCGLSGSGKSTLIRTISALEPIREGKIIVDGVDVHARGTDANLLRRGIGFVFQSFNLFPHLSALDNVAIGLRRLMKLSKGEAHRRSHLLLERVGLSHRAAYMPADLSGGEQQRVAIARALSMQPKVMLFDEPTSALDPEMVGEVLKVIKDLSAEGMTMICVTHEMNFAREVADWIWLMEAGEIIEKARPAEFFENPQHASARRFVQSHLGRSEVSTLRESDANDHG
ncbi:amino acid ABC transporter ATP-binding protein [Aureimonas fodinaquatilis]|uniref:Amino acid ABC transporter ATP-binding protein n=1 Tax=Aureimonas fodinaquatilis TaxID=2565783 RepID=A0A5B0DUM5_9HYPH|nr:amino acid ABC transporter ATP-binding protein [Aureimonas fodinaquatilis]KAA0969645.1 amino acid ABC transporter ATP-binding protein [Aureimonas fodinaquatilis]